MCHSVCLLIYIAKPMLCFSPQCYHCLLIFYCGAHCGDIFSDHLVRSIFIIHFNTVSQLTIGLFHSLLHPTPSCMNYDVNSDHLSNWLYSHKQVKIERWRETSYELLIDSRLLYQLCHQASFYSHQNFISILLK